VSHFTSFLCLHKQNMENLFFTNFLMNSSPSSSNAIVPHLPRLSLFCQVSHIQKMSRRLLASKDRDWSKDATSLFFFPFFSNCNALRRSFFGLLGKGYNQCQDIRDIRKVKSGKDSTGTLSLVIHSVRFQKKTCKKVH